MTHSDDKGLRLPEKIAPHQVVIETLFADKEPAVKDKALEIYHELSKELRVKLDDSDKGIGFKSQE
jgi:prolyl-tRNA synthetase